MLDNIERRQDQKDFMKALKLQNEILASQNEMLEKILAFIEPVSAFFSALKLVTKVAAGIMTAAVSLYMAWDWLKDWIRHH